MTETFFFVKHIYLFRIYKEDPPNNRELLKVFPNFSYKFIWRSFIEKYTTKFSAPV